MPFGYDNETQQHLYAGWLWFGDWYSDAEGNLYIIPVEDTVAEIEGPDNHTLSSLNSICRESGMPTVEQAENLGLTPIYDWQRRFSHEDGYYYA